MKKKKNIFKKNKTVKRFKEEMAWIKTRFQWAFMSKKDMKTISIYAILGVVLFPVILVYAVFVLCEDVIPGIADYFTKKETA